MKLKKMYVSFVVRFDISAGILSALFSAFTLTGHIFHQGGFNDIDSWDPYLRDSGARAGLAASFLLQAILYYVIIHAIWKRMDAHAKRTTLHQGGGKIFQHEWISRHSFLTAFILIVLCWLPYLLIQYPGNLSYDAADQIYQTLGVFPKNMHYPYVSSLFFGQLFAFGRAVLDDNFGLFCIVLVQFVACSIIYALVCKQILGFSKNQRAYFAALAFYCLIPIFPEYAVTVIKETLYVALFTLFIMLCTRALATKTLTRPLSLALTLSGLALCFLRNDGLAILLLSLIALAIAIGKSRKRLVLPAAAILAVTLFTNNILLPEIGVSASVSSEMLSLPFQQTARYVAEHGDELTDYEKAVIGEAMQQEDVLRLAEIYMPDLSDPVKGFYQDVPNLKEYLSVWWGMFKKHPDTFIQATLDGTYGYFDPFTFIGVREYFFNSMQTFDGVPEEDRIHAYFVSDAQEGSPAAIRKASLVRYLYAWLELPVLKFTLTSIGFYTWLLIFFAAWMLRQRRLRDGAIFIAPLLVLCVCVVSPVNGLLRYALPFIATLPILIAFCLRNQHDCMEHKSNEATEYSD